jgi:hypothetical protein
MQVMRVMDVVLGEKIVGDLKKGSWKNDSQFLGK